MNDASSAPASLVPDPAATPPRAEADGRALVLGGGGSTGNAWLIGVLAGLLDAGLDVTDADVTVGTSAGATTAAQLAGATATHLLAGALAAAPTRRAGAPGGHAAPGGDPTGTDARGPDPAAAAGRPPAGSVADHLARTSAIIAAAGDAADMRRRMGAAALDRLAASDGSWQERWQATVASRLPAASWPARTLLITAVDARTGEPAVFDRHGGVDLVDAVAASCSSGLPYRIGDDWYLDGGYRRNENADLAVGCRRVLVLSPLGGRTLHPQAWGMQLAAQVDELRAAGSSVETIVPDAAAEHLFGARAMDLSLRPAAARAGHEQGVALADRLAGFWA